MFKQKSEPCTNLSFRFLISTSKHWFLRIINNKEREVTTDLIHDGRHDSVDVIMHFKISYRICQRGGGRHSKDRHSKTVLENLARANTEPVPRSI